MPRFYRIGGLVLALSGPAFSESEELARFRCPPTQADLWVEVELAASPELPRTQPVHQTLFTDYFPGGRVVRMEDGRVLFVERERTENRIQIQFSEYALQYYGCNMAMRILNLPNRLLRYGGVFLHASCIALGDRAILFTAPSGGGKSTQAELWRKLRGARIVNGDRVLLRKVGGVWTAFGSPYCGTSGICEAAACPVSAMVLLGKSGENTVRPAAPRETLRALLAGFAYAPWDEAQTRRVLTLADAMIREIPVLRLDCRADAGAVKELEDALWSKK